MHLDNRLAAPCMGGGREDKTSTIGCKIRGVRTVTGADSTPSYSEDWTRMVKIEGCDYKITEEMLLSWLAEYGEIESELVEDVFDDSEDSEGENATGTYSIKIKLHTPIPNFLPIDGRRVKVYYRGMRKLCTNCFYQHLKADCKNEKVKWIDYVKWFVSKNPEFTTEQYGRWIQILEKEDKQEAIYREHFQAKQQKNQQETTQAPEEGEHTTDKLKSEKVIK